MLIMDACMPCTMCNYFSYNSLLRILFHPILGPKILVIPIDHYQLDKAITAQNNKYPYQDMKYTVLA